MGNDKAAVLLCSGGLDSTTLAFWLEEQNVSFVPLFINYGQHCAKTELNTAQTVLPAAVREDLQVIDISDIYRCSSSRLISEANLWLDPVVDEDLYLPYRNTVFLSIGSAYAQSRGIRALYAGFINSNHAKEINCSAEFFGQLSALLTAYGSVEVRIPFREMSKQQVAELALTLKVPLGSTFSCQVSSEVPCGVCPNCVERLTALHALQERYAE